MDTSILEKDIEDKKQAITGRNKNIELLKMQNDIDKQQLKIMEKGLAKIKAKNGDQAD